MRGSIMVVDDEPNILEAFDVVLGSSYELHLASSAEEALLTPPEDADSVKIIFLDGNLGLGLSGQRALPLLKNQFPNASFIYISALAPTDHQALLSTGFSEVLTKPLDVKVLLRIAHDTIEGH